MAHHSYQDFRWLSPTTASQPTWDTRSSQATAASLSRTQSGALADPIDSYEDFSGDNGEGENMTAGRTRQRRSSTGPWASGNSISSNGDGTTTELWACPFCKWKPLRYQGCHTYKLKEISRVKQHLRRKHRIPPHCDVCAEEFADEEARLAHVRAQGCSMTQSCVQKTWEGVTPEQQELLERRAERNKTKVEQVSWYFDSTMRKVPENWQTLTSVWGQTKHSGTRFTRSCSRAKHRRHHPTSTSSCPHRCTRSRHFWPRTRLPRS